jgi:hypothetical protein
MQTYAKKKERSYVTNFSMNNKSIYFIEDLSRSNVELLTQLLSLQSFAPLPSWLSDQTCLVASFPPTLLAPSALIPRLIMHLHFTAPKAILCPTHKPLNPHLIRRIFMQVSAECTARVHRLAENKDLAPELRVYVKRLQAINSLSMVPEIYRVAFQVQPGDARFERVESGCEACILARVGGSRQCLADLRSSALSRKRKSRPSPRILPLLEGWIDWTGEGDAIRNESDVMASELKKVRREAKAAKKYKTKGGKRGARSGKAQALQVGNIDDIGEDVGEGEGSGEEKDFEGSIINFYHNVVSTTNLLSMEMNRSSAALREDESLIHPAFRTTSRCPPDFGEYSDKSKEPPPEPPPPPSARRPRAYSQSVYSLDSGLGGSEMMREEQKSALDQEALGIADKEAQSYRKLVGISESLLEARESPFKSRSRDPFRDPRNPFTNSKFSFEDEEEQDEEEQNIKGYRLTRWSDFFRN